MWKRPGKALLMPFRVCPKSDDLLPILGYTVKVRTGGQRVHDYESQVEKMRSRGLDPADFEGYLMMHKYGMPPHGGLGIGLERIAVQLLGMKNIRHASLFPRDTGRVEP